MHIPEHLASIGYQDPASADDTAYLSMPLNPEKLNFFAACRWRPNYQEEYVACMSEITRSKQDWTEYYDTDHLVDEVVLEKAQRTPVFVDISGNAGDDVMRFLKKHPNVPKGSLVLQDVPDVIDIVSATLSSGAFGGEETMLRRSSNYASARNMCTCMYVLTQKPK